MMGEGWVKDTDVRFFTFPVELLRERVEDMGGVELQHGAFVDIRLVCSNAFAYAVYARCKDYGQDSKDAFAYFRNPAGDDWRKWCYNRGQQLYDSFTRPVLVSVNKDIILDFIHNPKTDFEIAVFCAFCGLRSIVGTKPYAKTNNGLLLARMFGNKSVAEFEALESYYLDNFSTAQKIRYQLTERIIKNELALKWGLAYYSNRSKGFYFSFKLRFDALVLHAEKSRKSTQLKLQQAEQRQIVERIRKQVRGK